MKKNMRDIIKCVTVLFALWVNLGCVYADTKGMFDPRYLIGNLYYNLDATNKTATVTYSSNKYSGAITIPSSVTYNSVTYKVTTIGEQAFDGCSGITSLTIPTSVTTIERYAFHSYPLQNITLPNSITSIGDYAFYYSQLLSITIPYSVKSIGDWAFYGSALQSVTISTNIVTTGLESIGKRAFSNAGSMTSITIPASVTSIGDDAFAAEDYSWLPIGHIASINVATSNKNYSSANGVLFNKDKTTLIAFPPGKSGDYTIPNTVTSIKSNAFKAITQLTSVTIPSSVTNIELPNFYNNYRLTAINVDAGNPNYCSVDGVLFNKNRTTLLLYPENKGADYVIPNSVTSIGTHAFYKCRNLANVTIPSGVTEIGNYAFYYSTKIKSIVIPKNVTSIGNSALAKCTGLTSIYCEAYTPPTCPNVYVFDEVKKSIPLYVPKGCVDAYKAATGWKAFTNIIGYYDAPETFVITVSSSNTASGTVSGGGEYINGASVQLTATPNDCYEFVRWTDGNTDNPRTVVVTGNATYTAEFEKMSYTVKGKDSTGGHVEVEK